MAIIMRNYAGSIIHDTCYDLYDSARGIIDLEFQSFTDMDEFEEYRYDERNDADWNRYCEEEESEDLNKAKPTSGRFRWGE